MRRHAAAQTAAQSAALTAGLTAALLALATGCSSDLAHYPAQNALGPYSGAVGTDTLLFVSGKIGDPAAPFEGQARAALAAADAELTRAGLGWDRAVNVTVYLTDMNHYAPFNEIYAATLPSPYPARAVVAVDALPAGALVEIAVVAAR